MHRVLTNNLKNRLYFRLSGNVDSRESKNVLDQIIKSLEELRPGFDIISDIAGYIPISKSADVNVVALLKTVKEHGVRKAIQIDSNPNSSSSFATKVLIDNVGFCNYEIVNSLEEAEQLLENYN